MITQLIKNIEQKSNECKNTKLIELSIMEPMWQNKIADIKVKWRTATKKYNEKKLKVYILKTMHEFSWDSGSDLYLVEQPMPP